MSQKTLPFWKRLDQWLRPASAVPAAKPAVPAPSPDFERRGATRHPVHVQTQCMLIALVKSDPWLVLVRDISCTGIGFEFPCPLPVGTFVMLELPRPSRRDAQKMVRARVVSSREQEDGGYLIGCMLTKRLGEKEVEHMA